MKKLAPKTPALALQLGLSRFLLMPGCGFIVFSGFIFHLLVNVAREQLLPILLSLQFSPGQLLVG
ncbi:MAG: hypothetical protein HO274_00240 [Ferrovum myxofaciens]|uniref:hypothetical protein n=1 Tax=Ferrovum myxofaciens TaxID=416213 RepID=UPI002354CA07|nr:hypothetical protein [Ferrovum myxofaciens]QKE39934.1 MAG: hypothetical protein HO274_00240 [Ferrovum myxofaciens]